MLGVVYDECRSKSIGLNVLWPKLTFAAVIHVMHCFLKMIKLLFCFCIYDHKLFEEGVNS
jgi:hypothetical protein